MMIDVGAYGALGYLPSKATVANASPIGQGSSGFMPSQESIIGATPIQETAANQASIGFTAAMNMRNRSAKLGQTAMAVAQRQWTNVANDIEEMGGTAATAGAGYDPYADEGFYADVQPGGISPEMKPYLYAGLAVAGAAAIYLFMRR